VPAVVAAIVGVSGLAVLALIRPVFAVAAGLALAVAFTGDLIAGRRGRRAGGELARARAAARARLVEVLGTDLAAAGAVAAVLANGAGLGARPLSPAILAFAALLTMTMFEVAGSLAAAGPAAGQALAGWRRLTEMTGLGARQAVLQPPAPASGAWARGDIVLRGLLAGMGDEPALSISALHLPGGGFTVLTGASGAGKSTLLRVLAGALRPMAGSVRIGGTDPYRLGYDDLVAAVTLMEQDSQLLSGTGRGKSLPGDVTAAPAFPLAGTEVGRLRERRSGVPV
jgi:ABC-type transport system involved in cytochrome bd biosynthesis fused ATPase/permease subunit